jgi:hypothetical protein
MSHISYMTLDRGLSRRLVSSAKVKRSVLGVAVEVGLKTPSGLTIGGQAETAIIHEPGPTLTVAASGC